MAPMAVPAASGGKGTDKDYCLQARAGHAVGGYGPLAGAWPGAAVDECGEAIEEALQPELEQVI
jgi:hypothetical protein